MTENEIIYTESIPDEKYIRIVDNSLRYAIISLPFTINRMDISSLYRKILNIAKGKIAEALFGYYCESNSIEINSSICSTPFYKADKRDFILFENEWDIKNNFVYHLDELMKSSDYLKLPALIPNRGTWDQWEKRNTKQFQKSNHTCFLFTFMKNSDSINNRKEFLSFQLSDFQQNLMLKLCTKFQGRQQTIAPFSENDFWSYFFKHQNDSKIGCKIFHKPQLVITAYATAQHWDLFSDSGEGVKIYHQNRLITKINNMFCMIEKLPSFKSLINSNFISRS